MGGLQRFEQRLENMVYGAFARVFRSAVQPVEIAAALERECDNNAQILSRQRRAVPNDFHVELAGTDFDRLAPYDSTLVAGPDPAAPGARRPAALRLPGSGHDRLRERRRT